MSYSEKRSLFRMRLNVPPPMARSVCDGKETRKSVVKGLRGCGVLFCSKHSLQRLTIVSAGASRRHTVFEPTPGRSV